MTTQMGQIAGMLDTIETERTPLQEKLGSLGKYIGIGCLLICAVVTVTGIIRGRACIRYAFNWDFAGCCCDTRGIACGCDDCLGACCVQNGKAGRTDPKVACSGNDGVRTSYLHG